MHKFFWDLDGTIFRGFPSIGHLSMHIFFGGKRSAKELEAIEQLENDSAKGIDKYKGKLLRFMHQPRLRPPFPGLETFLEQMTIQFGEDIHYAITGRPLRHMEQLTKRALERWGLKDSFQDKVFLKPKGYSSTEFKLLKLKEFTKDDAKAGDKSFYFENDILTGLKIARELPELEVYIKESLETKRFILKLLNVSTLPDNMKFYAGYADLLKEFKNTA